MADDRHDCHLKSIDSSRANHQVCARTGFSIVELIVCFGVVMILIGISLPTFARARRGARLTVWLATVQQHAHLIDMYTTQFGEVFPISSVSRVGDAARDWWRPLQASGMLVDSDGAPNSEVAAMRVSACFVYEPSLMRPGLANHTSLWNRTACPVRRSDVLNPTLKGLVWMPYVVPELAEPRSNAWCCLGSSPPGPIGFADGSAAVLSWKDFAIDDSMYVEHDIGYVVISTWDGVRGVDRRK